MPNKYSTKGESVRDQILAYLKSKQAVISPVSIREICEATGISSTSVASYHLEILEHEGRIKRPGHARHIEIIEENE